MTKVILLISAIFLYSCGGNSENHSNEPEACSTGIELFYWVEDLSTGESFITSECILPDKSCRQAKCANADNCPIICIKDRKTYF